MIRHEKLVVLLSHKECRNQLRVPLIVFRPVLLLEYKVAGMKGRESLFQQFSICDLLATEL